MAHLHLQKIYIPGDNDIGGELPDIRTEGKEKRFVRHFENITGLVRFGFIDYVKVCNKKHYYESKNSIYLILSFFCILCCLKSAVLIFDIWYLMMI